jgi:hypothetical protein
MASPGQSTLPVFEGPEDVVDEAGQHAVDMTADPRLGVRLTPSRPAPENAMILLGGVR